MGIGRWRHPFSPSRLCLPDGWYGRSYPDPLPRAMVFQVSGPSSSCSYALSINFAGRGKTAFQCGARDAYSSAAGFNFSSSIINLNIWRAYIDGVWTSSTTILVYCSVGTGVGSSASVLAGIDSGSFTEPYINAVTLSGVTPDAPGGFCSSRPCPTNLLATVTVTDAGIITIA